MRALPSGVRSRLNIGNRASAAVEFAVIMPVLLVLMMGGIQLVLYIEAVQKVELVAASISQMLSQTPPSSGNASIGYVNATDIHFSYDATLVLFPYIMKDAARNNVAWWQDITIDYASILFGPSVPGCTGPSCTIVGTVQWTSTGFGDTNYRPCTIPQLPAANAAKPTRTLLPQSLFVAGATVIAIDVVFNFKPSFGSAFFQSVRIARSVYLQPRYVSQITYSPGTDSLVTTCS